jgi:phage shock protein PspC (stress-responsive transcriptional regulator)
MKKLHLSKNNKIIGGVCGGLAEYFNFDPTIIRLIWLIVVILSGFFPGIFIYLVCWLIMPQQKMKMR